MPARDEARARVLAEVSPEAGRRLSLYADLLRHWQRTINLVAPASLDDLWHRHIEDSLQVSASLPAAKLWLDLGSGGGFPGLVTAIVLADTPGACVHLVESDKRKAAFLRTVSRETGAPTKIHAARIEAVVPELTDPIEAISARALAPLAQLVGHVAPLLEAGAIGVFPKGQTAGTELTEFVAAHKFHIESRPSRTDPAACLLIVKAKQPSET